MQIGIIGGGITGLSTALALQKFGFSSVIFERKRSVSHVTNGAS